MSFGDRTSRLNEGLILDIMYINGKPIFHIVDECTHFSAARFLPDVSTKTVWATIVECRASVYTGLPNSLRADQGSQLQDSFVNIGRASGVQVNHSGVESHNALSIGERYHHPLRNTFRKRRMIYPNVSDTTTLALSVKAFNDTLGPECIVPSALVFVFGEYPSLRVFGESAEPKSTFEAPCTLAKEARQEVERHIAKLRVNRALKSKVPQATDTFFEVGQRVLVWRQKVISNRIGEWMGPFVVFGVDRDKNLVFVTDEKACKPPKPFGFAHVKLYNSPAHISRAFFATLPHAFQKCSTAEKLIQRDTHLTEVFYKTDPSCHSVAMGNATRT